MLKHFKRIMAVAGQSDDLLRAQLQMLARQIPLLYFVLVANVSFVAATHYAVAPIWLTVVLPLIFAVIAIKRQVSWLQLRRTQMTIAETVKKLRSAVWMVAIFGGAITVWAFALLPYGGSLQQAHIAFFMAVTMVACTFCLMHLRPAALLLSAAISIPFVIKFMFMDHAIFKALAMNVVLVAGAMIFILYNHYEDFARMIQQRSDLERKNIETQRLSDENYRLANVDSLTGLPNRRRFFAMLEARVASGKPFAAGLVDLDGFKAVNDLYGHGAGDALLVEASFRLKSLTALGMQFARLGGDEFGFLTDDTEAPAHGLAICETLRQVYVIDAVSAEVSASCGIALFPQSGRTASELVEFADYALYQAKANATGSVTLFNIVHRDALRLTNQIDQTLRTVDLKSELSLAYQPTFETQSGDVTCVEALVRWNNSNLLGVSAGQIIATAERSQLIHRVTQALLERLLVEVKDWPDTVKVAFNLSARCLASAECMLRIVSTIQQSGIDPHRLEFEVTETAVMLDFEVALRGLNLLRNLGCSIALDDFGTGYSSLSYVHRLPLDKVKIDGGFVRNMLGDEKARNIVRTIISLADDLKIFCVAEAVETEDQAKFLREAGCDHMQGYLYARPMPPGEMSALLKKNSRARAQIVTNRSKGGAVNHL